MPEVIEANDLAQLQPYRLQWKSLWQQTRLASFFQTQEWLEAYWKHFGHSQRLRVLLVKSARDLIGILPLVEKTEATRVGLIRVLTYPLHDWGAFYGPIGASAAATLYCGLQYLRRDRRHWDLLDLRWIDPRIDAGRTSVAMHRAGFQSWEGPWESTLLIDFRRGWEAYLASRKSKFRNNLRRAERRARAVGAVTYERYRPAGAMHGDDHPRWDLVHDCLRVAARSWQGNSRTGTTLSHAPVAAFFRDTHAAAVRCGAVDLNLLRLNGDPIAFSYNYVHDGRLCGLRMGFDPRQFALSPGGLLLARSLEDSFRRGDQYLDLGPRSWQAKRSWHTDVVTCFRCTHYAWSPRAQLLRLKRLIVRTRRGEAAK